MTFEPIGAAVEPVVEPEATVALTGAQVHTLCVRSDDRERVGANEKHELLVWGSDLANPRVLKGHRDQVRALGYLPDGRLVSASLDGSVRLWSTELAEPVQTWLHPAPVFAIAVKADHVVSGGWDSVVRVWSAESGDCQLRLEGHVDSVVAVAIAEVSGADPIIISASADGFVRSWDLASGAPLLVMQVSSRALDAFALSPCGRRCAVATAAGAVVVLDVGSGERLVEWPAGGLVGQLLFDLSGARVLCARLDGRVQVFNLDGGTPVEVEVLVNSPCPLELHPDGAHVLLLSTYGAQLRRLADGGVARVFSQSFPPRFGALACSADGKTVWGTSRDRLLRYASTPLTEAHCHTQRVMGFRVLGDGRVLSWSNDGTIGLWEPASGERLLELAHGEPVVSVAIHPTDGKVLVGGLSSVSVWDLGTGRRLGKVSTAGSAVAWTKDGRILAAGNAVRLALLDAGLNEVFRIPNPANAFDSETRLIVALPDRAQARQRSRFETARCRVAREKSDGNRAFICGHGCDSGAVVDLASGALTRYGLAVGKSARNDGIGAAWGGAPLTASRSGTVALWDVDRPKPVATHAQPGANTSLYVGQEGDWAVALEGRHFRLLEVGASSLTLVGELDEPEEHLRSFARAPDGALLCGAESGRLVRWDVRTQERSVLWESGASLSAVAVLPNGTLVYGQGMGNVRFLRRAS